MSGYGILARVLTAWTGGVTYTGAGGALLCPAQARDSAASLLTRLAMAVYARDGESLAWSVGASGIVSVQGSETFALGLAGNAGTRTGLTGTYASASSYVAAAPMSDAWAPQRGLRMGSPLLATSTRGAVVGDGSAASSPMRSAASSRVVAWDDDVSALVLGREYDYWHDGRLFGRVVIDGARYVPLGTVRRTDAITLELDVREVG